MVRISRRLSRRQRPTLVFTQPIDGPPVTTQTTFFHSVACSLRRLVVVDAINFDRDSFCGIRDVDWTVRCVELDEPAVTEDAMEPTSPQGRTEVPSCDGD